MNLLPIIAGGAAFLLLSGKKKKMKSGNGETSGNGRGLKPGIHDLKVGQTVRLLPSRKYFAYDGSIRLDGAGAGSQDGTAFVIVKSEGVAVPHEPDSVMHTYKDFRPLKPGTFEYSIRSYEMLGYMDPTTPMGWADHTDDEFVFVVT